MQFIALAMLVIFFFAVLTASCLVGLIFGCFTVAMIKGVTWRRRLAFSTTCALPFVFWALPTSAFTLHWVYTEKTSVPGSCALPNGYGLMIGERRSPGTVFKLGSQNWATDAVDGVKTLQVTGTYILGARDNHGVAAKPDGPIDSYFVLDTQAGTLKSLSSFRELQIVASMLGINLDLDDFYITYARFGMPSIRIDRFAILLLTPVLIWLFVRWLTRLREFNSSAPMTPL